MSWLYMDILEREGFKSPTPIQHQAIPVAIGAAILPFANRAASGCKNTDTR